MKKSFLRILSVLIALTFVLFTFASCNGTPDEPEVPNGNEDVNDPDDSTGDNKEPAGDEEQGGAVLPQDIVWSIDGKDGKSGYQLAVESGFKGTIDEWFDHFADTEDADTAEELRELLTTKHQLRVNEDGSFKVLVFSDVQSKNMKINPETVNNIKVVCEREKPNLVIFNGDNCYDIYNTRSMEIYVAVMSKWCEDNKVPWAHVYGNHDDETPIGEGSVPKEKQQEIYESFDYCISKAGDPDIAGVGNYVLPVYTYDGTAIAFNVWGLDSGGYAVPNKVLEHVNVDGNYFYGHYEGMDSNQVNWYYKTSQKLEKFHGGKVLGMMTFHIPLQETWTAWSQKDALGLEWDGEKRENISAYAKNSGLFDKIVLRKDVKLIVNSHDHINDFSIAYKGVKFAYTACIGTEEYHADDMLGGRVVNFSMEDSTDFETHMSYVQERIPVAPGAPILELEIGSDGTVKNGVVGRPEVVDYKASSGSKTVSKDTTINKNVITFTPNSTMWKPTSSYRLPASSVNEIIKDGFAFETYFKVDNVDKFDKYVGILDYEEAGGFGLVINKSGDKWVLALEFAIGPNSAGREWKMLYHDLTLGEWTHCVFSYSGPNKDTMELYINGVLVGSMNLNADMVLPAFSGEPAISIGGCTDSGDKTRNGFAGSIAICNIFSEPVTAAEATALYNAVK